MTELSRRRWMLAAGTTAAALVTSDTPATVVPAALEPVAAPPIRPGEPRYEDLARRRINARFDPRPAQFRVPTCTEQVVRAVQDAVRAGRRITVRSGGHGQENFVGEGNHGLVIDLVELNRVEFDPARQAFLIEPGARLMDVYQKLYFGWGVTIPGGQCGTVGAGGHIQGGGYGPLSRMFGSTVDHLYGVEVVVVDRAGNAHVVVATREPDDPHHDLWWAHTGGGGGNFGVVTKYWMRSPGATAGTDPARILPQPPASMLSGSVEWSWQDLRKDTFRLLLRNHGAWHARNSVPGTPQARLFSALFITNNSAAATFQATADVDGTLPGAQRLLDDYLDALSARTSGRRREQTRAPWYEATWRTVQGQIAQPFRYKQKAAYLRRQYTDAQIDTIHDTLTRPGNDMLALELLSYGGQVNAVAPEATALPQRDSVMKALFVGGWADAAGDAEAIRRVAQFYSDVYADTGGFPVPNAVSDGCYINYPDIDVLSRQWNPTGIAWPALYYKGNYPRLQRVKRDYDPRNVFWHALSVELSASEKPQVTEDRHIIGG
ncbi:FAD-binding protein [Amycolatopsis sp. NPDC051102]|uniref:FAD-binding oxidoreductase n=1 Tax=Amycolatopsis sp. NPDC051102 TaxID=3155163 RepID=UPI003416DC96